MAAKAALEALGNAKIKPEEIDAIIFSATTQDFFEPATVNVVQEIIGARNSFCFDLKNVCNSFLSALDVADSLIKTSKAKNVLIVSGEVFSRLIKDHAENRGEAEQLSMAHAFGDGGAAFVVSAAEDTDRGIYQSRFLTVGNYWSNNVMWGGGVRFPRDPEKFYFNITSSNLKNFLTLGIPFIKEKLAAVGWPVESVDFFVGGQLSKYAVTEVFKQIGVPLERTIFTLTEWGATGAAGVAMATHVAVSTGKIKQGDRVVLFGAGLGITLGIICIIW